jgi:hypothetical protein
LRKPENSFLNLKEKKLNTLSSQQIIQYHQFIEKRARNIFCVLLKRKEFGANTGSADKENMGSFGLGEDDETVKVPQWNRTEPRVLKESNGGGKKRRDAGANTMGVGVGGGRVKRDTNTRKNVY